MHVGSLGPRLLLTLPATSSSTSRISSRQPSMSAEVMHSIAFWRSCVKLRSTL
jgi:hypothetical protein